MEIVKIIVSKFHPAVYSGLAIKKVIDQIGWKMWETLTTQEKGWIAKACIEQVRENRKNEQF